MVFLAGFFSPSGFFNSPRSIGGAAVCKSTMAVNCDTHTLLGHHTIVCILYIIYMYMCVYIYIYIVVGSMVWGFYGFPGAPLMCPQPTPCDLHLVHTAPLPFWQPALPFVGNAWWLNEPQLFLVKPWWFKEPLLFLVYGQEVLIWLEGGASRLKDISLQLLCLSCFPAVCE